MSGKGRSGAGDKPKCVNAECSKPGLHLCSRCMSATYVLLRRVPEGALEARWPQARMYESRCDSAFSNSTAGCEAAARMAVHGRATGGGSEAGACIICLNEEPPPIQSGCACRGDAGLAHVECRAEDAAFFMARGGGLAKAAGAKKFNGWHMYSTCKHSFTGAMSVGLAEAWWSSAQHLPEEDMQRLAAAIGMAGAFYDQGNYIEAETVYREVLEVQQRVQGPEHPRTLQTTWRLSGTVQRQGRYAEAETMCRELLAVQRRVHSLGPEHPNMLATYCSLAKALSAQGKHDEAETMYRETLAIQQRVHGPEHPQTLATTWSLVNTLCAQGRPDKAETMCREMLVVALREFGAEHPNTLSTSVSLADALCAQGKHDEVETMYRKTLAVQERVLGPEHPVTLSTSVSLADALCAQGKHDEAEIMYRKTFAVLQRVLGHEHPHTLITADALAACVESARVTPNPSI
jgi:tetratricopeptide (TPR) repeat protein